MICISIKLLITDGAKGHPVPINFYGVPPLFGACVYSFMCHHSLPGLLAPLRNKSKVSQILSFDYILICMFYIILAMTGILLLSMSRIFTHSIFFHIKLIPKTFYQMYILALTTFCHYSQYLHYPRVFQLSH